MKKGYNKNNNTNVKIYYSQNLIASIPKKHSFRSLAVSAKTLFVLCAVVLSVSVPAASYIKQINNQTRKLLSQNANPLTFISHA